MFVLSGARTINCWVEQAQPGLGRESRFPTRHIDTDRRMKNQREHGQ